MTKHIFQHYCNPSVYIIIHYKLIYPLLYPLIHTLYMKHVTSNAQHPSTYIDSNTFLNDKTYSIEHHRPADSMQTQLHFTNETVSD